MAAAADPYHQGQAIGFSSAGYRGPNDTIPSTDQHGPGSGSAGDECSMVFQDVKALYNLLQCLRSGGKEVCTVKIDEEGLVVHFQDGSKSFQCSVHLKPELFSVFHCPPTAAFDFGLHLNTLLDTLGIFAAAPSPTGLQIHYSNSRRELRLSMTDTGDSGPHSLTTHASVRAVEIPDEGDLLAFWEGPFSSFITRGSYPKEIVEDLEWAGGPVEVLMMDRPARVVMSSSGTPGSLKEEIPAEEIHSLELALANEEAVREVMSEGMRGEQILRNTYKYRAMKAAFCSLPVDKMASLSDSSTKIQIDRHGMLKVYHLIKLAPLVQDPLSQRPVSIQDEQRAVITFVIVPDDEELPE